MSARRDARRARARRRARPPARPGSEFLLTGFDPIAFGLYGVPPAGEPPSPRRARPARRPRREAPAPRCYYVGRRSEDSAADVYLVGTHVEPLRSSLRLAAELEWGRDAPGTLALAHAILVHALAVPPTEEACRRLAREVLAVLDPDGFVLAWEEVVLGMVDLTLPVDTSRDDRPGPLARAAARIRRGRRRG